MVWWGIGIGAVVLLVLTVAFAPPDLRDVLAEIFTAIAELLTGLDL